MAGDTGATDAVDPDGYVWPTEPAPQQPRPGAALLVVLYGAPFLFLLLFPAIAWVALLPLTPVVRRTTHPAHRRRVTWIYAVTGLISLAPWVGMLLT